MKWLSLGVLGLGVVGCASPRMVPPGDVARGSQVLEVADRSAWTGSLANESFKLGAYQVADVDRDWMKKSGFGVAGYSKDATTTGYTYALKAGAAAWNGSCASKSEKQGIAVLGGEAAWGKMSITCECKSGDSRASVVVGGAAPEASQDMGGELTTGGARYRVSPVIETDSSSSSDSPVGFRFDGETGPVGAVEWLRPGRVWLTERLPEAEKTPVACLAAGLMLYQAPREG